MAGVRRLDIPMKDRRRSRPPSEISIL